METQESSDVSAGGIYFTLETQNSQINWKISSLHKLFTSASKLKGLGC